MVAEVHTPKMVTVQAIKVNQEVLEAEAAIQVQVAVQVINHQLHHLKVIAVVADMVVLFFQAVVAEVKVLPDNQLVVVTLVAEQPV